MARRDSGVVNHNIELAVTPERLFTKRRHLHRLADIGQTEIASPGVCRGCGTFVDVGHEDGGARAPQPLRNRCPYAGPSAGHDGGFAGQFEHRDTASSASNMNPHCSIVAPASARSCTDIRSSSSATCLWLKSLS